MIHTDLKVSKPVICVSTFCLLLHHNCIEEEGNEDLASAYPHYCGGEVDDMIDQLVTCDSDDDDVQQFNDTQAVEAEENQDQVYM